MTDPDARYPKAATGKPVTLEAQAETRDGRRFSPSASRNQDAVREAFLKHMPSVGRVLEIASGTGEHGAYITAALPDMTWTYSDADPGCLSSQASWAASADHDRLRGPCHLDTSAPDWGQAEAQAPYDGLFCANMIHIAPFEAAIGLFAGAGRVLADTGKLFLYGPFVRQGDIAPSNARFDGFLKQRDARWGVRDLEVDILPLAEQNGLVLETIIDMPANNMSVIFTRR